MQESIGTGSICKRERHACGTVRAINRCVRLVLELRLGGVACTSKMWRALAARPPSSLPRAGIERGVQGTCRQEGGPNVPLTTRLYPPLRSVRMPGVVDQSAQETLLPGLPVAQCAPLAPPNDGSELPAAPAESIPSAGIPLLRRHARRSALSRCPSAAKSAHCRCSGSISGSFEPGSTPSGGPPSAVGPSKGSSLAASTAHMGLLCHNRATSPPPATTSHHGLPQHSAPTTGSPKDPPGSRGTQEGTTAPSNGPKFVNISAHTASPHYRTTSPSPAATSLHSLVRQSEPIIGSPEDPPGSRGTQEGPTAPSDGSNFADIAAHNSALSKEQRRLACANAPAAAAHALFDQRARCVPPLPQCSSCNCWPPFVTAGVPLRSRRSRRAHRKLAIQCPTPGGCHHSGSQQV